MSTVNMPEPATYPSDAWVKEFFGEPDDCGFYAFHGDFGNIAYKFQRAAQASNLITTTQAEAYANAMVREAQQWQPIEAAPKDKAVLLGRFNAHGKWRTMRGKWFSKEHIDENWDDSDDFESGWYETSVEADDVPSCWPTTPSHWMPLPAPPQQ